jgi:glycosyltransferase involved in cell wall biosynthesis
MKRFGIGFFLWLCVLGAVEKPLVVLIPSYNNAKWVKKNLKSVATQNYSNYRVIYIDDCSEDHTEKLVQKYLDEFELRARTQYIRNSERKKALENIYGGVCSCEEDEIVLLLDGDDWFAHENVLKRINEVYSTSDVWLTHGSFIEYPTLVNWWSEEIPDHIVRDNLFRMYRCPSHLRTFYAWLFKRIDVEDLKEDGRFFEMSSDQAIMFPMIEMAGERHAFLSDVLYVYNRSNAINDNKVDPGLQNRIEAMVRAKPPYQRLNRMEKSNTSRHLPNIFSP